jgi:transcriptional regulator with XRE-family HTH domain
MTPSELRKRRGMLGLSQGKLGERLGVPSNTIARWERGELAIEHPAMLRLALDRLLIERVKAVEPTMRPDHPGYRDKVPPAEPDGSEVRPSR